jgi:hypothetical protein
MSVIFLRADLVQSPPWASQTEKITTKEIALRMMNLTRWTQVRTQTLHGVAGTRHLSSFFLEHLSFYFC